MYQPPFPGQTQANTYYPQSPVFRPMKRIFITGANGFVGNALAHQLGSQGYRVTRFIHRPKSQSANEPGENVVIGDLEELIDWGQILESLDIVIHLAARVHIMKDTLIAPFSEFQKINTDATLNLARSAAQSGIKRFIYLSSIKVNGEQTTPGKPFSEVDPPAPEDAYAISKLEAEHGLHEIAQKHNLEVVIIRPPLIYGPGVKANFLSMMEWLNMGIPLPLGAIDNKRSLLGLDNLLNFIVTCIEHPAAANEVFMIADGEDLSTTELLRRVGNALGKSVRLFSIPQKFSEIGLQIMGKRSLRQRLFGTLQINITKANELLGWNPPYSIEEGLRKVAQDFIRSKHFLHCFLLAIYSI